MNLLVMFFVFIVYHAQTMISVSRASKQKYGHKPDHLIHRKKRSELPVFEDPKDISRDDARKYFEKYYKCLGEKNEKGTKDEYISAVIAQEGQDILLKCNLCLRPDRHINSYNIMWKRLDQSSGQEKIVNTHKGDKFILARNKDLKITQIDVSDSGQFFCMQHGEYEAIYQVDVLVAEEMRVMMENRKKKPLADIHLVDRNIKVTTTWSKWTDCNKCNEVGLRRKVGICTVKKISKSKPIKPDAPMFKYYPDGVPCRSTVLPPNIGELRQIKYRKSEILLGKCSVPCPTVAAIRNVTNNKGEVIRKVEVQYYSLDAKPTLPPTVKRKVKYQDVGKRLILKCPTDKPTKMLRWQNGTTAINRLTIRRKSRGRVKIDTGNRLCIRRVKQWDTAMYSCWQTDELLATIKVIVTKRLNKNIKKYVSYIGCALTIITVICLAVSLCKSSAKKTAQ